MPLRSCPTWAERLDELSSGPETYVSPLLSADQAIVAVFFTNSPAIPVASSRTLNRFIPAAQWTANDTVALLDDPSFSALIMLK